MRALMAFWANLVMANVWAAAGKPYAFASFAVMAGICLTLHYLLENK
jgi:hypothetical protein